MPTLSLIRASTTPLFSLSAFGILAWMGHTDRMTCQTFRLAQGFCGRVHHIVLLVNFNRILAICKFLYTEIPLSFSEHNDIVAL